MAGTIVTLLNASTSDDEALPCADAQSAPQLREDKERVMSPHSSLRQDHFDNMSENAGSLNVSAHDTDEETIGSDDTGESSDLVFEQIKNRLSRMQEDDSKGRSSSFSSSGTSEENGSSSNVSEHLTNIPYGIQPKDAYEHGRKDTDIMGVSYNGRMRQFVMLDSKGIVCWKRDAVDNRVRRCMSYPKYEYRLITYLLYARKYNCYFALWKDFSLKVLNRDFVETCSVSADLRSVLFMLFNPIRDELITGGVGGIKVYRFHQAASKVITELKPLANYQLTLQYALPNVGGSWVKKVELDYNLEHLYCCSDTDLHVYNLEGKELFKFNRAHTMSITGCRYSLAAKVLVTSSIDTEVKVWSLTGGLVHTFRGHSRAVTNLIVHPHNSTLILTCSLDGSLRMWSLDTMDAIYSLVVSTYGLLWMGVTDDNLLYITTARNLTLWHLNHFLHFWSLTRNQVTRLQLEGCPGKTQRVLAVGEDSSIRLFARSNQKNLSTVLPPPNVSPLQKIVGVCYSREFNVIFVLINPTLIWVYTTRTDPACRIAVWDVLRIQAMSAKADARVQERTLLLSSKPGLTHRATENGVGNELPCPCLCVCILKSSAMLWTDEGCCCPVRHSYLLLGMEDGRVLFMDPVVKGQKFMEFKVSKDPVVGLHHEVDHQCLTTMSRTAHLMLLQFWSLPDLELLHEVFCLPDLTAHARIGYMCMTGHESGCVLFHTLELANDPGLHKGRFMPDVEAVGSASHRPEHNAPIITVDACVPMGIFCSCSNDGAIKVWEEGGALLTEIMLDDSLSAACFLNKSADLIVAYQKHIFFISHSKVCPHLKPEDPEDHTFDKESYVYEDPSVTYEGVVADPDPIDLENYLVPFEIEFSKDFLEGKLTLEPTKEESEESDEEGNLSLAPTDIYLSPPSTPGSLSMVDLTLRSEVSKYDLLQQMKLTLQMLIARGQALRSREDLFEEEDSETEEFETEETSLEKHKQKKQKKRTGASAITGDKMEEGQGPELMAGEGEESDREDVKRFEFPRFEGSPGPTPTLTPSSTPEAVSEAESSEGEQSDIEDQVKELLPPKKIPDMQLVAAAAIQEKAKKETGQTVKEDSLPTPKRTRKAISDVEIDIESLMRGARHAPPVAAVRKEADHSHAGGSSLDIGERLMGIRFPHLARPHDQEGAQAKSHRAPVKKKSVVQRKLTKRGSRSALGQDRKHAEGKEGAATMTDDGATSGIVGQEKHQPSQKSEPSAVETEDGDSMRRETISVDIRVRSISPAPVTPPPVSQPQDETIGRVDIPPLPSVPDSEDHRPVSSKSYRSVKSADRRRPMEFLRDRPGAEVGMSPTAELESQWERGDGASEGISRAGGISPQTVASTADTAPLYGPRGSLLGSWVGEGGEEGTVRAKSQMSWVSSQEGDRQLMAEEGMGSPDSMFPDAELASISVRESSGHADEDEHRAWSRVGLPDPTLAEEDRPFTTALPARPDQFEHLIKRRPFTAAQTSFHTELELMLEVPTKADELKAVFEAALHRYKKTHGSTSEGSEKLYVNKGVSFEGKWHERVLERHMLLRMQRVLRAHAAQQRRQMMSQQRVKSAPQHKGHVLGIDAQGKLSRPKTANPSLLRSRLPTTTPAPSPAGSRPHTASSRPEVTSVSPQQKPTAPLQENLQHRQVQKEKELLGDEQPYRLRIRESSGDSPPVTPRRHKVRVDPWLLDPRNPGAVRPPSSKSIPSKCSRYVLLSRPRTVSDMPTPTALEEELLAARFPSQSMRVLQSAGSPLHPTPPHTSYGISYTPFSLYS